VSQSPSDPPLTADSFDDASAANEPGRSQAVGEVRLKPNRQFPFWARHPWVHAHALMRDGRELNCGDVVDVVDCDGNFVGRGLINPQSRLRVRLYTFREDVSLDAGLWRERIDAAIARRRLVRQAGPQEAERLVFSESDLISGLIVDRYADCLGVQFTAAALSRWRDEILAHLQSVCQSSQIVVRVDEKTAKFEGLAAECAVAFSSSSDAISTDGNSLPVTYQQNDLQLSVDLLGGQKTGGYLDQRENHDVAAGFCGGRRVLDVCCYTGGFGLLAAKRGAESVVGIDTSAAAIEHAKAAAERNGVGQKMSFFQEDCFDALKRLADQGEQFGVVILDPPRFAGSRHQVEQALRAYRRLNQSALSLLPPGGILVTCSCSGRVTRTDFMNMLVDVGRRSHRDLIVLENRGAASDHPLALSCPESEYLKCVVAQVM
jgi:23S rRNA (cytosine1962-C5)-methyltransferase